jgi:hypothetical protein
MANVVTLYGFLLGASLGAFVLASMIGLPFLAFDTLRAKRIRPRQPSSPR